MAQQRMTVCLGLLLVCCQGASADGVRLDSREYKLMLDPAKFPGSQTTDAVDRLWSEVKPIIAARLDPRNNGEPRHGGHFRLDEKRIVLFRDTKDCLLDRNGYSLRERIDLKNGEENRAKREVTLKFRTSDIVLAASAQLPGARQNPKTKLEEDVAPLIVRMFDASGREAGVFAPSRSTRSMFSMSTSQRVDSDQTLETIKDVMQLYPTFEARLEQAGAKGVSPGTTLIRGNRLRELVYEGAKVDLGKDADGEFALTLWSSSRAANSAHPLIAELSFKYATHGRVDSAVARRALMLFTALQAGLGGWARPEHATKTSLGLPSHCQ